MALIFDSSAFSAVNLKIFEISIMFQGLAEFSQMRPFLPNATSNLTHLPNFYSNFVWIASCLYCGSQKTKPSLSSPIQLLFLPENPLLIQLSLPPINLLYSKTRQKTVAPTFKFGLFLFVTPSNSRPPNRASRGAPISTMKVSAVRIFIVPITRSFFEGKYCRGKRVRVRRFFLGVRDGKPAQREIRPDSVGRKTDELYYFCYTGRMQSCPGNKKTFPI